MKYLRSIIPALLAILVMSCTEMNNDTDNKDQSNNGDKQTHSTFATADDAAKAGQRDMLAAMDKVNFGIDKNALKSATVGNAISKNEVDWNKLLSADTTATFASIAGSGRATIVPLVNNGSVVTVITLLNKDQQFAIGGLGEKRTSDELNMVWRMTKGGQAGVTIYEVPNVQATVYEVVMDNEQYYYTTYNGNSIRRPVNMAQLLKVLQTDARRFQKQFGDQTKGNKLVK